MCGARRFACCPLVRLRSSSGTSQLVYVAENFLLRLAGLAGLARPPGGAGLLLPRCRCVHTLGMRFPIDVVFLSLSPDSRGRAEVLELRERVSPGRVVLLRRGRPTSRGTVAVAELPSGSASALALREGATVLLRPVHCLPRAIA